MRSGAHDHKSEVTNNDTWGEQEVKVTIKQEMAKHGRN